MEAPFHVETKPLAIERIEETGPKREESKQIVQECEEKTRNTLDRQTRPGDLILSDVSAIVYGRVVQYSM